jgi:hypothetical protein
MLSFLRNKLHVHLPGFLRRLLLPGEGRSEYGQQVMDGLSARLVQCYGNGFSITTLRYI